MRGPGSISDILKFIIVIFCFETMFYEAYASKEVADYKSLRKIQMRDRLDSIFNMLIDKNEDLDLKEHSYNNAMVSWSSGKVILNNNDTLLGKIKINVYAGRANKGQIIFQQDGSNSILYYTANRIKGFEKFNSIFLSKKTETSSPFFIEILEEGRINLYYRKVVQRNINSRGEMISIYKKEFYIELSDNMGIVYGPVPQSNRMFIDFMVKRLQDYPQLKAKVASGVYKYDNIREIIQIYNMSF